MRKAKVQRNTKETKISATVNLDGTGRSKIETGIGFLDHMVEQISRHGLIDLDLKAKGDLHIDDHHTTEDSGYVLAFAIAKSFSSSYLNGMRILITAGPTKEAIDPVRYLTNNSSGKMGYALAESAFLAGAQVDLVSGPVSINAYEGVNLHKINSADEMLEKIKTLINDIDIFIGCAAVADFKPTNYIDSKIKKTDENNMSINLTKNPDILKYASDKMKDKIVIGFSAETDNIIENARLKLSKKELDMIICNDVSDPSIGFDSDNNEVHIITKDYEKKLRKTSKIRIAKEILKNIEPLIN